MLSFIQMLSFMLTEEIPCAVPACSNYCPNGYKNNARGCPTCSCGEDRAWVVYVVSAVSPWPESSVNTRSFIPKSTCIVLNGFLNERLRWLVYLWLSIFIYKPWLVNEGGLKRECLIQWNFFPTKNKPRSKISRGASDRGLTVVARNKFYYSLVVATVTVGNSVTDSEWPGCSWLHIIQISIWLITVFKIFNKQVVYHR